MIRKIIDNIPDERVQQDLEKFRQRAIELGANDAKIITADKVIIDERVVAKCIYPKCGYYGTNAHCPPHAMDLEQVRKIVNNFRYAIFTICRASPEEILRRDVKDTTLTPSSPKQNYEIVSKVEAEAFYDGYHLALGFANGPCKLVFCPDKECAALIPGQACRHPLRGRSSMEGAGMDAYIMATRVGWDVYPMGKTMEPTEVPFGVRLGLVLIY